MPLLSFWTCYTLKFQDILLAYWFYHGLPKQLESPCREKTKEIQHEWDYEPAGRCFTKKETIALTDILCLFLFFSSPLYLPLSVSLYFCLSLSLSFKISFPFILWVELWLDSEVWNTLGKFVILRDKKKKIFLKLKGARWLLRAECTDNQQKGMIGSSLLTTLYWSRYYYNSFIDVRTSLREIE